MRRERGLQIFGHVSDRFSDPFSRFSNHFSDRSKTFSGAISFCRHADVIKFAAAAEICAISVHSGAQCEYVGYTGG